MDSKYSNLIQKKRQDLSNQQEQHDEAHFLGVKTSNQENKMNQNEDKYEFYFLQAQDHMINGENNLAVNNLILALNFAIVQKDRLLQIASEFEKLKLNYLSLYIHDLIKEMDQSYDHPIPENGDDYLNIVKEFILKKQVRYLSGKQVIEKLIQLSESKVDTLLLVGKLILENNDNEILIGEAEQYFKRASSLSEDKYETLLRIGDIHLRYSRRYLSEPYYDQALIINPDRFEAHLKIIFMILYSDYEVKYTKEEAIKYIQKLKIPEERQIYIKLGLLFNFEETCQEGFAYLLKAAELSENKFETLVEIANMKEIHFSNGGYNLKKMLLRKAIELNWNDLKTLTQYVEFYFENYKQFEKTEDLLNIINRILELNPKFNKIYIYQMETLEVLGRKDEVIEKLKIAAQMCPQYNIVSKLGRLLQESDQIEESLKYFKIALQLDLPDSYINTVEFLFDSDMFEECLYFCIEFQEYHIQISYYYRFKSLFQLKRSEEGLAVLLKATSVCEGYDFTHIGKQLLENSQVELAFKYFKMAIEQRESNDIYEQIVTSLFQNKHFDQCIQYCDQGLMFDPNSCKSYLFKGKSLFELARYNEAIPQLQIVITTDIMYKHKDDDIDEAEYIIRKIEQIKLETQSPAQQNQDIK